MLNAEEVDRLNPSYNIVEELAIIGALKMLQKRSHALAQQKGFYEEPRTIGDAIALIHSECSEALDEFRDSTSVEDLLHVRYREDGKPEGFSIELADAVIRLGDLAESLGIDLGAMIVLKHAWNETRPHRHGNKKI